MNRQKQHYWRRVKQGLCVRCGASRGKTGTETMCRPCADTENTKSQASKKRVDGRKWAKCENCFKSFRYKGSGSHRPSFCDPCAPWFPSNRNGDMGPVDHAREQEQA